ncbi:MAG: hypothetical protein ABSC36_05420 [Gaiellaceae bacterium]|jgi:hypothetical protein
MQPSKPEEIADEATLADLEIVLDEITRDQARGRVVVRLPHSLLEPIHSDCRIWAEDGRPCDLVGFARIATMKVDWIDAAEALGLG